MMQLKQLRPSLPLQEFINLYRIVEFALPDMSALPPKAYPPRPETCLQFFFTPGLLLYPESDVVIRPKNAMVIGQHTCITNRVVNERLFSLQVVFTPAGFYRLTNIPATEFFNKSIEASEVFGPEVDDIADQLQEASSHSHMISVIEKFILGLIRRQRIGTHPIDLACLSMLRQFDSKPLDHFVKNSFLSHRQFDRKFIERTGVGAKEFIRVARFYNAYLMKNAKPGLDWLSVAIHCGYHDYQHLVRDYRDFTGFTPVQFFQLDSPERTLGMEEVYPS
ncbi:MAG: AraC family transcriptional regulator [Chitinophagaceae bacterium]|nr:MAG: AraC family transcriptional regulator [Chitinophagaceae bacterium]